MAELESPGTEVQAEISRNLRYCPSYINPAGYDSESPNSGTEDRTPVPEVKIRRLNRLSHTPVLLCLLGYFTKIMYRPLDTVGVVVGGRYLEAEGQAK
ncbi:hypothetical protein CLU79DRAFT_886323 [Phycomyces nitens]|nr:hypothetical protein CLU79DRAFT_886323 [Phycomyces nitens]